MNRGVLVPVAVLLLGGGIAALLVVASSRGAPARELAERCGTIAAGDTADEVLSRMGLEGYRPGCGASVPCEQVDLGGHQGVPWLCDPSDCSLLWRAGDVACFVDLDPATRRVTEVVPMEAP